VNEWMNGRMMNDKHLLFAYSHIRTFTIRYSPLAIRLLPLVFLAVFFFYPLLAIFRLSLAPQGHLDLAAPVSWSARRTTPARCGSPPGRPPCPPCSL